MNLRGFLRVALAMILLSLCTAPSGARTLAQGDATVNRAAGGNRAAIVFALPSGQVVVRVVPFEGESIKGLALAQASGLPLVVWSNLLCKVGPQGCDNPSTYDECFCQCSAQSGKCEFWRYFHWRDGQWQFSGAGAAEYAVPPNGIDGWAWGDNAARPPEIDPVAIGDARRLAPGLARATATAGALRVEIDVQGDENHNAAVLARYRPTGGAWSAAGLTLTRQGNTYSGAWSAPLQPGTYEISVAFTDSEGINGSAAITETVRVEASQRLWLPMLLRPSEPR